MIQKVIRAKIKEKYLAVLAVLGLVLLLVPLLRLACYAVPWYDDYNFMGRARGFSIQSGKGYFYGALQTMRQEWYAWQGTYATTFLTALNPCLYGEEYQKFGIMGVILVFTLSMLVFGNVVLGNFLKAEKSSKWLMSSVVAASCIGLIYTAQQGLYWYNAAVHYTLMAGIMFLMLASVVKILYCEKTFLKVLFMLLAMVLGIICGGSNYVTILQGLLLLLTILSLSIFFRRKNWQFLILPTITFAIAFWINVSAPGNSKRGASYQGDGAIQAILNSFIAAGKYFWELTGPMMLVCMLLLVPVIVNIVKKSDYAFKLPGLVTLYSICLYATGFTSSRYAMGTDGLSRTWVTIKYTLQILLYLNEIYWAGWIVKKRESKGKDSEAAHYILHYIAMACLILGVFYLSPNQAGWYSPYGAYYYVHTGEAYNFYHEYLDRVEILKSDEMDIVFEPYRFKPWLLCLNDLSENPDAEENCALANWYGKNTVRCREQEKE